MSKKVILILFTVLVLVGGVLYSFLLQNKAKTGSYNNTITIGVVPFPGYSGLFIARDEEFFKETGLDVKIKSYNTIIEQIAAYNKGEIQMAALNVADAVGVSFGGIDSKIVSIIDYSSGVDAIIGNVSIKSINDIKGKRVAYEEGTLEEFFLASVLREYALSLDDVVSINASPEDSAKKLTAGEVDVAVTYEPYLSSALKDNNVRIVYSTNEDPSMISDVLMTTTSFVDNNPEIIKKILTSYFKALTYLDTNPEESYTIIAKEFGIKENEAKNQLQGVLILTLAENKKAFKPGEFEESFYLRLDAVGQFLTRIKGISNRINTDTLIDPSFIRSLSQ